MRAPRPVFLTTPGPSRCRIHAVRTGKGSGKPLLLFVHGFPEFWFSWKHQLEAFRRVCGCVGM